jgi:hypothetical protein
MNELIESTALKPSDLELVVKEHSLGVLVTNAQNIREVVRKKLADFDIKNYDESNIEYAKKDKAVLNNFSKTLSSERLRLEREFMQPFNEFKEVVNDTVKLIGECSSQIDTVVKGVEEKEKAKKYDILLTYFLEHQFHLVEFEKIFDPKWLNKTAQIKNIQKEIDAKISQINDDLKMLEAFDADDVELLKSMYLDKLNINATVAHAQVLKQNRATLKAVEEEKELARKAIEDEKNRRLEAEIEAAKNANPTVFDMVENLVVSEDGGDCGDTVEEVEEVAEVEIVHQEPVATVEPPPEIETRYFRVDTTMENLLALSDFMNERGIVFEKIEMGDKKRCAN